MPPGPKPKPTALKEAQGNPGHRKLNKSEPKPPEMPALMATTAPAHLTDVGKRKWLELAQLLGSQRILTVMDAELLTRYCELHQEYMLCLNEINSKAPAGGLVLTGEKGGKYANPAWNIAQSIRAMMIKILGEFGMTPSSRSRLMLPEPKPQSKMDKYRGSKKD